ncbi:hypothetical protein Q5P01_019874 [Channa striata]|uniref:Uromodulin-like 1 n=1 Tax=Channa striata TaxID=64152 RepID=A0AA88M1S2_CHASR|nr:hypothetical protein Q5P01_019874 [Channa striata]
MMEIWELQPGVLYNVTVTPQACGNHGLTLSITVRTDALTIDATVRITNIQFSADLQNASSQAYRNLTESIVEQIYKSLSPEMKTMIDLGLVRIEIRSFSPGSVMVNFTIISVPSQDITNVSTDVVHSLMNSSKYTVDANSTRISDFDECASGQNDCSMWATCTNTWGSYNCVCLDGFIDINSGRPGRDCQVTVAKEFLLNNNIRDSNLYLGMVECGVNGGNDTHFDLTVAWDECRTMLVHNETYYTASVTLFSTMESYVWPNGSVETPRVQLELPVMCTYMKSMLISADYGSMGYDVIKDVIMGLGSFQVTVQLMNGTVPLPHNYSLSPEEVVVVEVSLNTSLEQIKVVVNKCWATPTQNPIDTNSYVFLDNSCSLNTQTKVLTNGNSSRSRISVQIFSFVDLNVIYVHCQVQICVPTVSKTCVADCTQKITRASSPWGSGLGSSEALLRSEQKTLEQESNNLHTIGLACIGIGLSLVFIVGFVCLFYYQRNRIGHYNFSPKPNQENFTYLAHNA